MRFRTCTADRSGFHNRIPWATSLPALPTVIGGPSSQSAHTKPPTTHGMVIFKTSLSWLTVRERGKPLKRARRRWDVVARRRAPTYLPRAALAPFGDQVSTKHVYFKRSYK